jgi:hypothetical protein
MPDVNDNKTVTLPNPKTDQPAAANQVARPSQSDAGQSKAPGAVPATAGATQPREQEPNNPRPVNTPAQPTSSKQASPADNRTTAPAPQTDTTQKPNPTPSVQKPTGGVFVGGVNKAAVPEPKHDDSVAEQPEGPQWNRRGNVTPETVNDFVYVERVPGNLPFRGVCLKCGWQSQQPTEQAGKDAVLRHLGKHYREVVV